MAVQSPLVWRPTVTRRLGKKRGAMIVGSVAFVGAPLPRLLRLLGWLPGNDSPVIFWIVLGTNIVDLGLIICHQILTNSMMAVLSRYQLDRSGHEENLRLLAGRRLASAGKN